MSRLNEYELAEVNEQANQVADYQQNPMQSLVSTSPAIAREVARVFVQTQAALAKPRDYNRTITVVSTECKRKALAEQAIYRYARGGNDIVGPSIRLAEALARAYGNISFGYEVISQTKISSTIRAYALDLETNMQAERTFTVEHVRDNGNKVTTQRDIYEHISNSASRRVRACILELIPGDIIDYAMDECTKTLAETVRVDAKAIKNLLEAFKTFNVSQEMLEDFIQRKIEAIEPDQILRLRQIYQGLKNGVSDVSDFFKTPDDSIATSKQRLADNKPEVEKKPAKKAAKKTAKNENEEVVLEAENESKKEVAEEPKTYAYEEATSSSYEADLGPEKYQDDQEELLEL